MTTVPAISRRAFVAGAFACAACTDLSRGASGAPADARPGPFKKASRTPIGGCITSAQIADRRFAKMFARNFNQLTAEYEMKMGAMLLRNGQVDFRAADRIAAFAKAKGIALHGHTLIWEKHQPPYFMGLDGKKDAFARAYRGYIAAVAGHFKGKVRGWDVVNEPLLHNGSGLKPSLWGKNLGEIDYIVDAFAAAAEADPGAVLFLNEYGLEQFPTKRLNYMKLIETLLKRKVKLGGIGTQTHLDIDHANGATKATISDLASFGLPVHVSEFDLSFGKAPPASRTLEAKRDLQVRRAQEAIDAFFALPERQRYAFTFWGLTDRDSYLRKPPFSREGDEPHLFDERGRAKKMTKALYDAIVAHGSPTGV